MTTLIAAAVAATLATAGGQLLSKAARHQVLVSPGTTVALNATVPASELGSATATVQRALRAALGSTPFTLQSATWSDPLPFPAAPKNAALARGTASPSAASPGTASRGPASPGTASRRARPTVDETQAAALSGIESQAVLVTGHWPARSAPDRGRIPAALPEAAASRLHLAAGDTLSLRDAISHRPVRVLITGIFRPRRPASPYWRLDLIGASGASTAGQFTTYGPLVVQPTAFGHGMGVSGESWVAVPDLAALPQTSLGMVATRLTGQLQRLTGPDSPLGGLRAATRLPQVLRATTDGLAVARSLLIITTLQLLLLATAALTASARLLASRRDGEVALIAARGGARWQLAGLSAAEAAPLALAAAAAGGLASGSVATMLATTGPLRTAGLRVAGVPGVAWLTVGAVGVLAAIIMLTPVLRIAQPGTVRARHGRQAAVSRAAQASADVALIVLAALAVWQLRRYSAVSPSATGGLGVDPVLVVAPTVALAGGTVAGIRLLPFAAHAGERLARKGRWLTGALATWRISRRPLRQAGPALLVVLGVATGTLALSQHESWVRSAWDQAAFAAGAQARVTSPQPFTATQSARITAAAGRAPAMPVAGEAQGGSGEVLALDSRTAASTVLIRPDLTAEPEGTLFSRLAPASLPGQVMKGRPGKVLLAASLGPASLRLGPVPVTVAVQYADGQTYSLPAGPVPADGRDHTLTLSLPGQPVYPVRLLQISVVYTMPVQQSAHAVLTVSARGSSGRRASHAVTLSRWPATVASPDLADLIHESEAGPSSPPGLLSWRPAPGGARALEFATGYGRSFSNESSARITGQVTLYAPGEHLAAIPGIATRTFLNASNLTVGSVVQPAFGGSPVPVRITRSVAAFPTVTGRGGALVVDLASLEDALVSRGQAPAGVTQWWLGAQPRSGPLPPGVTVTTRIGVAAALLSNPVTGTPQQALLVIAVAGALLALAGFTVSVTATVSERRAESALLSALGVSRAAQVRQLCLEELMLSGPAALAGLVLGAGGALLLVPALTLSTTATAPIPPVRVDLAWPQVLTLTLVVAALPVLLAALTAARRLDPAAQLRAAEAG